MNNSTVAGIYADPDPVSALLMGIWFAFLAVVGIPLNLFILISTLTLTELRSVPVNAFIASLALGKAIQCWITARHQRFLYPTQRWAPEEVQGVQNLPCSAWVKTDAASKTANATSFETRLLATLVFTTRCMVHFAPFVPPGATSGQAQYCANSVLTLRNLFVPP
jgi:hypothetical protein